MSSTADFDASLLTKIARSEFLPLFQSHHGPKSLVIDDRLLKCLDRLVSNSILRQMEFTKIYRLQQFDPSTCDDFQYCSHRFYLIKSADLSTTRKILNHTNYRERNSSSNPNSKFKITIIYWPRKTYMCLDLIEKHGLYGEIGVEEFNPGFVVLSNDLISLEWPEFFVSTFLDETCEWSQMEKKSYLSSIDGDHEIQNAEEQKFVTYISKFHTVAHSILKFKLLYGDFGTFYCLGKASNDVYKLTQRLFCLHDSRSSSTSSLLTRNLDLNLPKADLILFDRNLDYVSVFLSCLTYESLLDDTLGVNCGFVEFEDEKSTPQGEKSKNVKRNILLNDQDGVYIEIRDHHFSHIYEQLREYSREIKSKLEKRHQIEKINEMKTFIAKDLQVLRQKQKNLALHANLFETVFNKKLALQFSDLLNAECKTLNFDDLKFSVEFCENLICEQKPKIIPLSFLCLLSIIYDGLNQKDYYQLRKQFLQSYGHKYLNLLLNLKKLRILFEKERNLTQSLVTNSNKFQNLCKKLELLPKKTINSKNPVDCSYVFSGAFTPIICKLVGNILRGTFDGDDLRNIFGSNTVINKDTIHGHLLTDRQDHNGGPKIKIIYFLGGVTYAEIAALRLLNKVNFPQFKFVIAATHVINREKFIKSFCPDF
uniref:Vacuolar protein sorting-associated protein 33B n=1 Tax=Romanomermis culicivorax TaxID=13658 RepID=A0A915JTA9_ROMCU